jgi:hypothetical protein
VGSDQLKSGIEKMVYEVVRVYVLKSKAKKGSFTATNITGRNSVVHTATIFIAELSC